MYIASLLVWSAINATTHTFDLQMVIHLARGAFSFEVEATCDKTICYSYDLVSHTNGSQSRSYVIREAIDLVLVVHFWGPMLYPRVDAHISLRLHVGRASDNIVAKALPHRL